MPDQCKSRGSGQIGREGAAAAGNRKGKWIKPPVASQARAQRDIASVDDNRGMAIDNLNMVVAMVQHRAPQYSACQEQRNAQSPMTEYILPNWLTTNGEISTEKQEPRGINLKDSIWFERQALTRCKGAACGWCLKRPGINSESR